MQKLKSWLSPRRMIIIASIVVLIASIAFVNVPAQSETQGIVTAIAVDIVDDQIELACSIITPKNASQSQANLYHAKGDDVAEAVELIELQIGKQLGFAQCDLLALGPKIVEEKAVYALDYFSRTKKVGRNILLLNFMGETQDFIESSIYLDEKLSLSFSQILNYNKEHLVTVDSNLEKFYLGFYGDSGISIIPKIILSDSSMMGGVKVNVGDPKSEPASSSSSSSSQGGNADSGQAQKKDIFIINDGTTTVFRQGIKLFDLEPKEIERINLFSQDSKYGVFKVQNITDEIYDNATVVMRMENKEISYKYEFKEGKPLLKLKVEMFMKADEVVENGVNKKLLRREDELITDQVEQKLKEKVTGYILETFEKIKKENTDYFNFGDRYNKFHYKKWKKYLSTLENQNEYLKDFELDLELKIAQYL